MKMGKQFGIDSQYKMAMNQLHPMFDANAPVHAEYNPMWQWMRSNFSPFHIEKKYKNDPRRVFRKMLLYAMQQSYWQRVVHVRFYNNQTGELIYEHCVEQQ